MTAGVLLHYHGGSVYALPVRHVSGLVWDLAAALLEVPAVARATG